MKFVPLTSLFVAAAVGVSSIASAQTPPPPQSTSSAQPAAAGATFKQEELDAILAPIALYPDAALAGY